MDRNDLIKALGNAFEALKPKEEESSGSTVESAVAGEKDVLRLITNSDKTAKITLYSEFPEVSFVESLVNELQKSGQSDIEIVSRELILKFNNAVEANDKAKIQAVIDVCKEHFVRMQTISPSSPERALAYMMAINAIKKL